MSLRDASHCLTELASVEGLAILARGGKLELNDEGRERAALLASIVQAADSRSGS